MTALLAVLKSGAAYVPLDPSYPSERLAFLLRRRPGGLAREPGPSWPLPSPSRRVPGCGSTPRNWRRGRGAAPRLTEGKLRGAALPGNLAYLIYTSGSTGRPKAAAIEHRSACALLAWARAEYSEAELAGTLAATSVCFDLSVFEIFATFAAGGKVILADNALALPSLPARGEVTLFNTVPSAAAELVRQRAIPPGVRVVNLAGEPLSAALSDQLYALRHGRKGVRSLRPLGGHDLLHLRAADPGRTGHHRPGAAGVLPVYLVDEYFQPVPLGRRGRNRPRRGRFPRAATWTGPS